MPRYVIERNIPGAGTLSGSELVSEVHAVIDPITGNLTIPAPW